jgi:hypothetical protein
MFKEGYLEGVEEERERLKSSDCDDCEMQRAISSEVSTIFSSPHFEVLRAVFLGHFLRPSGNSRSL